MKTAHQLHLDYAQTSPLLLSIDHLENPYLVLEEFFGSRPLAQYRKTLDEWFKAALHPELNHPDIPNLYDFYQQLETLLHASYLMANAAVPQQNPKRAESILDTIYWSDLNDRQNPGAYLKATLTLSAISNLRLGLQEWLECAIGSDGCLADAEPAYGFDLYHTLHRLLEAWYLLSCTESHGNSIL